MSEVLGVVFFVAVCVVFYYAGRGKDKNGTGGVTKAEQQLWQHQKVVVREYVGDEYRARMWFQVDAQRMAERGYFPTAQTWIAGSYGCGAFAAALVLCLLLIGILIFLYMIIVKPAGKLVVTYELRETKELSRWV
jgi:hypothetical protein